MLLTVMAVGVGAWFALRRRAPALPAFVEETRPATPVPSASGPTTVTPVPEADPVSPTAPDGAGQAAEELRRVSGIGRRSAEALVVSGVDSLDRLAGTDDASLVAALDAAGLQRSATLSSWASQARRLDRS